MRSLQHTQSYCRWSYYTCRSPIGSGNLSGADAGRPPGAGSKRVSLHLHYHRQCDLMYGGGGYDSLAASAYAICPRGTRPSDEQAGREDLDRSDDPGRRRWLIWRYSWRPMSLPSSPAPTWSSTAASRLGYDRIVVNRKFPAPTSRAPC